MKRAIFRFTMVGSLLAAVLSPATALASPGAAADDPSLSKPERVVQPVLMSTAEYDKLKAAGTLDASDRWPAALVLLQ